jgi:hypothetical protein
MDRFEAARTLGLADTEVLDVKDTEDGTAARCRDGSERLITDDGVFALTDHPATTGFRRWDGSDAPAKALDEAREERVAEEKPDINVDLPPASKKQLAAETEATRVAKDDDSPEVSSEVPDGNADAVLDWVGDDRDRARQALAVEVERDNPRSTLISKLRKLADG